MKVKTLLAIASKCKTEKDAANFLSNFERIIGNQTLVSQLGIFNGDYTIEDEGVFVQFELIREISDHYCTAIRPEIRSGVFTIIVTTTRANDGQGISSQSYETIDGMDDSIETYPDQTISSLIKTAVDLAIANHGQLLQQAGLTDKVALQAARKSW